MPRVNRFLSIFLTLTFLTASFFSTPVLARDPLQGGLNYETDVFKPAINSQDVNLQSTVYEIVLSIVASLNDATFCTVETDANGDPINGADTHCTQVTVNITQAPNGKYYASGGMIPQVTTLSSTFFARPAVSSTEYLADIGNKLNLGVQPVYAQGVGYAGLQSLVQIWQAFRNIAYLFATAGFLVLAFMVMLRIKAGQGVINAQSSITKFIFVILAVSFSYAIAGFVVDLIYVFSGLIIAAFISTGLITGSIAEVEGNLLNGGLITTAGRLVSLSGSAGNNIGNIAGQLFGSLTGVTTGAFAWLFSDGIGGIARLIISIAIIYSLFKLFIQLLFAYLQIILYTLMAPLMILPDILPGGNAFFTWLRNIFAHAMVFPATIFVMLLGVAIIGDPSGTIGSSAPNTNSLMLPFLSFTTDSLQQILGVAFVLILPKVNSMVKDFFKVSSFKYTSEIGAAVGVGMAGTRRAAGIVTGPVRGAARQVQVDTLGAVENTFGTSTRYAGRAVAGWAARRKKQLGGG